jgi:hypothetical protein
MKTEKKKNNRDYKYVTESEHHSSSQDEEDEEQMSTNEYIESTTIETKSKSSNRKKSSSTANNSNKKNPKKRRSKRTQQNKNKSTTASSNRNENNDLYTSTASNSKHTTSKSSNLTASSHPDPNEKELRKVINDLFGYKIKEVDYVFIHDLMNDLVELHEIWDRIGFNKETKESRLDKFYQTLHDTVGGVMESEQDLEENILESIEQNKLQIKEMCIELHLKYDDLKVFNQTQKLTILEEDELLRVEHKRLQEQKKKRLDQFKQLSKIEGELCSKLGMKKLDIRSIVPTEQELNNLDKHIKELEKVYQERRSQMEDLKEEIVHLSEDIDMSRSDSFAELILFESVDALSLSEQDINRALTFRDDLKRKDNETLNEIRSLRAKIMELWSKLEIENLNLKSILLDTSNCEEGGNQWSLPESMSKRTLVAELRKEYEHCVQVKTENMQKFIEKTRAEIKDYCVKMFFGSEEMRKLDYDLFRHTNYNDDLLTLHEEKLDDLKFTFTEAETLFEKTQKWMEMWEKYMQFVETTKDPSRLTKRGYKMLEEEKQRKFFEKNLPKLEEELNHLAIEYSNMNGGKIYTIHGSYYADYIQHIKNEFEESKKKEKLEKQIIRDNVRQNESRFGTKFVATAVGGGGGTTPLRNKRPLNEKTPHEGKKKRTDIETTCINTPGSLMSNTRLHTNAHSKLAIPSAVAAGGTKTKLTLAKRKSKTPNAKRLMRKSRQLANAAAVAASNLAPPSSNESTILSTRSSNYDHADTTIKSSNHSNISNISSKVPKLIVTSSNNTSAQPQKYPPLSASSKYSSLNKYSTLSTSSLNGLGSNRKMLQHMTSTAQNTFIEEEDIENLEGYPDSMNITKKMNEKTATLGAHTTLGEVAAKMSRLITSTISSDTSIASSTSSKYGFKYSETKAANGKLDSFEVNYTDFSRDIKFNGSDATNRIGLISSGRSRMSTRSGGQSNDKLTSTLIKE